MEFEELRLQCHDISQALGINEKYYSTIVEEALIGNVSAAKVLANLMYHFEDVRAKSKGHALDFLELSKQYGFIYARLVFWISSTTKIEGLQKKIIEAISITMESDSRAELLRALCNQGGLDEDDSNALMNIVRHAWTSSDVESLFIIKQPQLTKEDIERIVLTLSNSDDMMQMLRSLRCVATDTNRSLLRQQILPSKKSKTEFKVKSKLDSLYGSIHPEQVLEAGKFCMALLSNRPARLVYHFGYGKVAGFLYMANINLSAPAEASNSSDEEDLQSSMSSAEFDLISGKSIISGKIKGDLQEPNLDEMTEEEKEAEAEKLMGLLKKLEDTGVAKVITK